MNKPLPTQGEIEELVKNLRFLRFEQPMVYQICRLAADALEALTTWQEIDWDEVPRSKNLELWFTGVEPYEQAQIMIGRIEVYGDRATPVIRSTIYNKHRDRFTHWRELPAPPSPASIKEGESK